MPVCPACGQSNPARARFCMSCATPLPGEEWAPHGARKTVTVVFCDVVGSTPLAERLDVESMREVITRFFREMRTVVERHGGTVEKFIGDAVMAVFGVPLLHEDDAIRAVRAAAGMRNALVELNAELEPRWEVTLRTRIGVNTGEVVVGDPASGQAVVVGDAVNVGARLQQRASPGEILLGPQTYALVRHRVEAEVTEALDLKGKREPIVAYRLVAVESGELSPGAQPDPPLVDRREELAALRSAFRRTVTDRAANVLTILGSAGVGKSRLAREFEADVEVASLILRARCLPYGDGITFWPVAELVKQACAITNGDSKGQARRKIDGVVEGAEDGALIAERVAAVSGFAPASAELQATFWAIRRFLEWLGRDRPVVVIFDDLQWGEAAFLDLLEYLAGWCRDTALFLLCLAREDFLEARPSLGSGLANASMLRLSPLRDEESHALIEALLGGTQLAGSATERITESAGGNPLFIEEMVRMLEDDGLIWGAASGRTVPADLSRIAVPASIHALLAARLDRLTTGERDVIRCASVVGKVFWWGAVADLVPESVRPHVAGHLQMLVRKGLIRPERSSFAGEDALRFHHILIQEAAYRGTPKRIRADLHERFAGWMERTAGERITESEEVVGYHLETAYRYLAELDAPGQARDELAIRAARRLAAVGHRAFARGDVVAASDLLGRAVELFPSAHPERRLPLTELAEALNEAGDLAGARDVLNVALELAEATGDAGLRANATILGLLFLESTDPKLRAEVGLSEAQVVIPVLEGLGDDLGLARAWRLMGELHWTRNRYADAGEAAARAIEHARRADAAWEEAASLALYVGSGLFGPSRIEEVVRRCEMAAEAARGVPAVEARTLRALAEIRAMEGAFDEARELVARARTLLDERGMRLRAAFASATAAYIERLAGDYAAAERELRSEYATFMELGDRGYLSTTAAYLANALVGQGKLEEAEILAKVSEDAGGEDDIATQVMRRSAEARVLAAKDRPTEAEARVREAVALAEQTDDLNMRGDTLVDLGEVLNAAGREAEAAEAFVHALERYEAKGNIVCATDARRRRATLEAAIRPDGKPVP